MKKLQFSNSELNISDRGYTRNIILPLATIILVIFMFRTGK